MPLSPALALEPARLISAKTESRPLHRGRRSSFVASVLEAIVLYFKMGNEAERKEQSRSSKRLSNMTPSLPPAHNKARGRHPSYPARLSVADSHVHWSVPVPDYSPPFYTHPTVYEHSRTVIEGGWADPEEVVALRAEIAQRPTSEGSIRFDPDTGAPLNPRGRTGLRGRGLLGKWGPNHAADSIVTRFHPTGGHLQMVAVERRDTGLWAIPGGMVAAGETVAQAVRRDFESEASRVEDERLLDETSFQETHHLLDELFAQGSPVYCGYVDDPRNTDNAWLETTAFHFHCSLELGALLPLGAGEDSTRVTWLDVNPLSEPRYANLYASHRDWVDKIADSFGKRRSERQAPEGYPARLAVPEGHGSWKVAWTGYDPPEYTDERVRRRVRPTPRRLWAPVREAVGTAEAMALSEAAADHEDADIDPDEVVALRANLNGRHTYEGPCDFDPDTGAPLNPRGRTGLRGRGLLGKWGPNHAADSIVTRFHPTGGHLQMVAVERRDTGLWAIPGGMVAAGETVAQAVRRDFESEASRVEDERLLDETSFQETHHLLDELFAQGSPVYCGYVDDPRNTDNAWLETTAFHFHCSLELGALLPLGAEGKQPRGGGASYTWFDVVRQGLDGYEFHPHAVQMWVAQVSVHRWAWIDRP